jgi:hypothetical protein
MTKTMRLALVSLMAAASLAPLAVAQTQPDAPTTAPPTSASPAPMAAAPEAPPPVAAAPPPAPTEPGTMTPGSAPAAPAVAETPPAPPAPPTDPAAIALLNTLETICVPSASHGDKDIGKAAKAAGYRKSGDLWVYKQPTFQFTLLPAGSNPNICQIQLSHPVDVAEPAKPFVVALHNWAVFGHGWNLVSNYKHTEGADQFITRSWEHDADGMNEALVLTTTRKADGSPEGRNSDTSMMIYSVTKAAS